MGGTCRVSLFGDFRVELDGVTVEATRWPTRRAADLVKILALASSHQLHREQLIDALWPELGPSAGAANLRKAMHFARRALGDEDAIRVDGGLVRLCSSGGLDVDVDRFEAAASQALAAGGPEEARAVIEKFPDDLLPEDTYASWSEAPRARLRRRRIELLRVAERWEELLESDPLDEEAHRALMRVYSEAGRRQEAIRQFERLRRALSDELGVSPHRDTIALYDEILAEEGTEPSTPAERARAHIAAALVALNRMDTREAEREAALGRAIASEEGLGKELGEASGVLGMAAHAQGHWRERFRVEFEDTLREVPHLAEFVFDAHLCLAEFSVHGSETPDEIERFARELLPVADRSNSKHGRAVALLMLGEAEFFADRLDAAEKSLGLAADLCGEAGASSGRALVLQRLAQVSVERGQRDRAVRLLDEAAGLSMKSPLDSHLLIRVHGTRIQEVLESGGAIDAVLKAENALSKQQLCDPCSVDYRVNGTIAYARAGDLVEARRWLEGVDRVIGMWQAGWSTAIAWQARAELRLAEGQKEQAAALFLEAAERFGRAGFRLHEDRSRERAGSVMTIST